MPIIESFFQNNSGIKLNNKKHSKASRAFVKIEIKNHKHCNKRNGVGFEENL